MSVRIGSILGAVVAGMAFQATAFGGIVFDNSVSNNQGITTASLPQLGDEVTAAGTLRTVTELDIGVTSQGAAATADLQAFLYANDGSGGAPGTLLWQSSVHSGVSLNTVNELISFSVPSIVVPDTFTFTASITNVVSSLSVGFVPASVQAPAHLTRHGLEARALSVRLRLHSKLRVASLPALRSQSLRRSRFSVWGWLESSRAGASASAASRLSRMRCTSPAASQDGANRRGNRADNGLDPGANPQAEQEVSDGDPSAALKKIAAG